MTVLRLMTITLCASSRPGVALDQGDGRRESHGGIGRAQRLMEAALNDDPDTAHVEDRPALRAEPPQTQAPAQATPCRKPPLRQRMRDVLEKLKPFPACD
jgi:hypothetical protein